MMIGGAAVLVATPALTKERPMADHIASLKRVIESWHRADADGVLAELHDDITWNNSGGLKPPIQGKAQMAATLGAMKGRLKNNRWRLFDVAQVGDTVWMEGVDEFDTMDGTRVAIPYCGILNYEDGKIRHWREYFDGRLQEEQIAGKGVRPTVDAMLTRKAV
jgi:limonene-1,2-epoxide hydrolase